MKAGDPVGYVLIEDDDDGGATVVGKMYRSAPKAISAKARAGATRARVYAVCPMVDE